MKPKVKQCKCLFCGKEVKRKPNQYCNNKCQQDFAYKKFVDRWLLGHKAGTSGKSNISGHVRRFLFEKNGNACQGCKWSKTNRFTNKIPLEVHHKDGNYKNNKLNNLELLCPSCHSLTDNFKSRNKVNTRKHR